MAKAVRKSEPHQNAAKRKYSAQVFNIFNYRGFKIREVLNKKTDRREFKCRFQINKKEFYLTDDRRKNLESIIDETLAQERRAKYELPTVQFSPTLEELFQKILTTINSRHRRNFCERVFRNFLDLVPSGLRVTELKKSHYQLYFDWRSPQLGIQSKKPLKAETVEKELWAVSSALTQGELYWSDLEGWKKPSMPKDPRRKSAKKTKRTKIVSPENELSVLLERLRAPRTGKQNLRSETHRCRLADELEFRYESGLRRKEVARLQLRQFNPIERVLRNVIRWKTDTVTKFFPLSRRACEIIENRIELMDNSQYIFTKDGEPVESDYRTLKIVCAELDIPYGKYTEDGFIPHDLRHNFATEISEHTDIETVRELLGHSNIGQTGVYLHTNENRLRDAVRKRENIDSKIELVQLYKGVRRGKIRVKKFLEVIKNMI